MEGRRKRSAGVSDKGLLYETAEAIQFHPKIEKLYDAYWSELLKVGAPNAGTMMDRERRAFAAGFFEGIIEGRKRHHLFDGSALPREDIALAGTSPNTPPQNKT